jgi:hypothetical protein
VTPEEVRAYWTEKAMRDMPPVLEVSAHCRAIAAKYGRFYQQDPETYSWAGVAAFAVHRIGMALMLYDFEVFDGEITKVAKDYKDPRGADKVFNDLNHLRQANNEFFKDVGWTLEAYLSPEGGIEAIELGLKDYAGHEKLLEAFRKIDEGRKLLASPGTRKAGEKKIWEGSMLIEYHGQVYSAQKFYDSCDFDFDLFMSVFTAMNFEAASFGMRLWKFTSFELFMWTGGLFKLLSSFSMPDLKNVQQRWYWIEKRVFPIWAKVIRKDQTLARNIDAIVRAGEMKRTATAS